MDRRDREVEGYGLEAERIYGSGVRAMVHGEPREAVDRAGGEVVGSGWIPRKMVAAEIGQGRIPRK